VLLLYLVTAVALLALAHFFVRPITRWAALVLLLFPLIFTGRALLTGRVYAPIEMAYMTHPLADHRHEWRVPSVHNGTLSDIAFQMLPWREAVRRSLAARQWPLWNPYMFCGDVLAAGMQPAAFSPFTLIALLLPTAVSFTFTGAIAFFIAGLGTFLFARELGVSETAALFAAAAWMFSAQLALTILWPLGFTWALFPLVLAATHRIVEQPDGRSIGFLTAALALDVLAGHPETLLHVVAIACAYGLFRLVWSKRRIRVIIAATIAGVLSLLLTAIALLPFLDAARHAAEYGIRTEMFAKEPLKPGRVSVRAGLRNTAMPFLRAETDSPLERAEPGSIVLAMGIAGLIAIRRREVAFFAVLLVIALLAGVNAWPVAHFLHSLPLFSSAFNDRMATVVPFCLAILGAFAFDAWPARRVAIVMVALALVMTVFASSQIQTVRAAAEIVPLLLGAVIVFFTRRSVALPVVFILLLIQRTVEDGSLVPAHPREMAYPPLALFKPLQTAQPPFRIAPLGMLLLPNTATMYGLEDVRGNTPMTFAPLAETFPLWRNRFPPAGGEVLDLTKPILSMMNVRYSLLDVLKPIPAGWREVTFDIYTRLIENEHALGRAFVPARVRFGRTPQQELEEMSVETDFSQRAWLTTPDQPPHERENGPGAVTVSRDGADLDLQIRMESDGFVVISETAWPGWRAHLDNRRVRLVRANHAFLAVFVPLGEHHVRLRYLPQSFVAGRTISLVTALCLAMFIVVRKVPLRRSQQT
jgi:hypothetical protein